ncbi:hypothetical protein M422DRAFT_776073 [Sphaerobolus stellatus SS14]|nr:hypothetical protein M422DRAFT_776073 [Sphaerobolus stellatus SS14]
MSAENLGGNSTGGNGDPPKLTEAQQYRQQRARWAKYGKCYLAGIKQEMTNHWIEDSTFLERFFSFIPGLEDKIKQAKKHEYNSRSERWSEIPGNVSSLPSLYDSFRLLFNNILLRKEVGIPSRSSRGTYGLKKQRRYFFSTYKEDFISKVTPLPEVITPLYLAGAGPEFVTADTAVYMFDRSGATFSPSFDFHKDPDLFCKLIYVLGGTDIQAIGFDETIFWMVKIFPTYGLCNHQDAEGHPGTLCWLVHKATDENAQYVIKDAWVSPDLPGKESEGSLLCLASQKGVIKGIPTFIHAEELRHEPQRKPVLDSILKNRRIAEPLEEHMKLQRVHCRLVMKSHGKLLSDFASRKELLLAFHDAVLAHRNLYQIAGILHRDISIRNILINPEGEEGNRGILIDLDNAVRVGDKSEYATQTNVGTYRFMSTNVLIRNLQQIYIDDLESFYYVLCWIMCRYEEPGQETDSLPYPVSEWDDTDTGFPCKIKHMMDGNWDKGEFQPYFGTSLPSLARDLGLFLRDRVCRYGLGEEERGAFPERDYEEYLSLIRHAINELEIEESK